MYPSLILKNQFGEQSENAVLGGSSRLNCNFIIDLANGNGLGLRSLKAEGIANVYMHTSATPAAGNPNPASGYILVEFAKGYAGYQDGTFGFVAPLSGTPILVASAGVTNHVAYAIVSVGTTTPAQWQALGVPANVVPSVGTMFIATVTGTTPGTGAVEIVKATGSGIDHIEACGDPNQGVQTTDGSGGSMILVCLGATNSSTTTLQATAPADGTIIGLAFNMIQAPTVVA